MEQEQTKQDAVLDLKKRLENLISKVESYSEKAKSNGCEHGKTDSE